MFGNEPLRILDIGAGAGGKLAMFAELGHEATGVEPDPGAISSKAGQRWHVYQGTAEELPSAVRDMQFDAVVFIHVLEHCLDPERAISNARSRLQRGGLCIVEVPNNDCLGIDFFGPAWFFLDVPRHLNFFTQASLVSALERNGFEVTHCFYRGYVRQFRTGWTTIQAHIGRSMRIGSLWRFAQAGFWYYLLRTAFARPARKYDSVRVVCRAV